MRRTIEHILTIPLAVILALVSLLPWRVLFWLSRGMAFLLYHVIGYRKKVVLQNLRHAFPTKTEAEIRAICRDFFLHFSDTSFETIKLLSVSKKSICRHYALSPAGLALVDGYYQRGESFICIFGHFGNWEWSGPAFRHGLRSRSAFAYRPLKNKVFNWLMLRIRSRFAHAMMPLSKVARMLIGMQKQGSPLVIGLIADQSPNPRQAYWMNFMNQDTAVNNGPEKLARRKNLPVVYFSIRKERRGFYRMEFEEIADQPAQLPEEEVTRRFMALLERDIRSAPAHYLWSHRRWKHRRASD